ncbi:hypothetical protein N9K76_04160 [Aquiluna sp.]|nr:hypothetical protein [Aquiluna sp.]
MLEPLYYVLLFLTLAVGTVQLLLGFIGRKPGQPEIMMSLAVLAGLAVQLLVSSILAISGERAVISTLEYFGYLLVAIIVQVAAWFWALAEKTKWSTVILGAASLTVAVMLVRMLQIWSGVSPLA